MQSVMVHDFSRAPTADIPRSSFNRSHGHKTTFDGGYLIPVYVDEALPGDTFNLDCSMFGRLSTPIHPLMDNMYLDIHFFSVPMRQLWTNFRKFMGERLNPSDSIDYEIPYISNFSPVDEGSIFDYMGIPEWGCDDPAVSALFFRAYNHIYNEWYRDQNLINAAPVLLTDGPDADSNYELKRRGKRHDYFTSCLPWLQKGDSVELPLGTSAPTYAANVYDDTLPDTDYGSLYITGSTGVIFSDNPPGTNHDIKITGVAELDSATAATVNEVRQAFQIQKLLERDARSGTRYSEIVQAHFGVDFYDPSYRPEYLGGGSVPINIHPVAQTGETNTTPQGNLAAFGTFGSQGGNGFTKSFTEHCIILGIASVRADLTYQQGLERMFTRATRYDFYWPALAHIGEQAVLNMEIYCEESGDYYGVFGYQERYAEYKYKPSRISGAFRSSAAAPLDSWHLSQEFDSQPGLDQTFIEENPPIDRVIEVDTEPHFIGDFFFNLQCARPMPLFSVPGLIDHF